MEEKTGRILEVFEEISRIPRCSKNEAAIGSWLMRRAQDSGFQAKQDKAGNIVVRVPATNGYENKSPIVLQGHLDMVCQRPTLVAGRSPPGQMVRRGGKDQLVGGPDEAVQGGRDGIVNEMADCRRGV